MGQFVKKVAFSGFLAMSSCSVCQAQSGWQWPTRSPQPNSSKQIAWDQLPSAPGPVARNTAGSNTAASGLLGPSDVGSLAGASVFPPRVNPPVAPVQPTNLGWDTVNSELPANGSRQPPAAVAKQVPWDATIGTAATGSQLPAPSRPAPLQSAQIFAQTPDTSGSVAAQQAPQGLIESIPWSPATKVTQAQVPPAQPSLPAVAKAAPVTTNTLPTASRAPATPANLPTTANVAAATQTSLPTASKNVATATPASLPTASNRSGLIGPTDYAMPMPQDAERPQPQLPTAAIVAAPQPEPQTEPRVSLIPMQVAAIPGNVRQPASAADKQENAPPREQSTYVLQNVRTPKAKAEQQTETLLPIDIIPFNRLVASSDTAIGSGTYSTAEMIGPMEDAGQMFSRLHIANDFRDVPAAPAGLVRIEAEPTGMGPEWMYHNYTWVSPTFYHRPLYFEQVNMERYGIGPRRAMQPFYSAGHFFTSIGMFPYKLLTQHPCERVYTLGHQRPGDCVAFQRRSLLGQSYPLEATRYFHNFSGYR